MLDSLEHGKEMFQQYFQETTTMSDKPNYEVFTTPVGELVYPWVTKPDVRYDPDGVYQTKLLLPFEGAQELIARLEGVRNSFTETLDVAKQKSYNPVAVYEEELDEEGAETGNVLIKFKLKALVTPREGDAFEQKPVVINAEDGAAIEQPVYGGTMARLKGQIVPYTNAMSKTVGVTLRLRAIQVHELVTGNGTGGGAFWSDFDESD